MSGKRLKAACKDLDQAKVYSFAEGVKVVKSKASAKFDETIEVAMNLNVDPRHADQQVRGVVLMPHGTGKNLKVLVIAKDQKAEAAKKAGADFVGAEDLVEKIQAGFTDFDRCIATPDLMALVGKLGKILGPKGLMPNPKLGTVTNDVGQAVENAKKGQIEFKTDKTGIVHAGIAKASFSEDQIVDNLKTFIDAILKAKPSGVKGSYVKHVCVSATMGPGIKVQF